MTTRAFTLALLWLTATGCASVKTSGQRGHSSRVSPSWSSADAIAVLQRGIDSEDPSIRAQAFENWISSGDPSMDAVVSRAAFDPSALVQQILAKGDPHRFGAALLGRPSPDVLALGWLAAAGVTVSVDGHQTESLVVRALQGDDEAHRVLLEQVRSGFVPADSGFFELVGQVKLEGLGSALLEGVEQAEQEVWVSMALSALMQGEDGAGPLLTRLLAESEEVADNFWVVEMLRQSLIQQANLLGEPSFLPEPDESHQA